MASSSQSVYKLYKSVIDDVINNVREAFLDEGVEDRLQDLRQTWEGKLLDSRAIAVNPPNASQSKHQRRVQEQDGQGHQRGAANQPIQMSSAASAALQQNMLHLQSQQMPNVPYSISQQSSSGSQQTFPSYHLHSQSQGGNVAGYQSVPVIIQPGSGNQQQPQQFVGGAPPSVALSSGSTRLKPKNNPPSILQVDGTNDSSDDDDDFDDDDDDKDDDDDDDDDKENDGAGGDEEEDPLNSDDDVSDEDPAELFEADNVVVCQYDKINRNRNKWKFNLKHGIMNLRGKDYVFNKSTGDADW